jgi:hypothetical protein
MGERPLAAALRTQGRATGAFPYSGAGDERILSGNVGLLLKKT